MSSSTKADIKKAKALLDQHSLLDYEKISFFNSPTKSEHTDHAIYVKGIPLKMPSHKIGAYFGQFGCIFSLSMFNEKSHHKNSGASSRHGVIRYYSKFAAASAIANANGKRLSNTKYTKKLVIDYAKKTNAMNEMELHLPWYKVCALLNHYIGPLRWSVMKDLKNSRTNSLYYSEGILHCHTSIIMRLGSIQTNGEAVIPIGNVPGPRNHSKYSAYSFLLKAGWTKACVNALKNVDLYVNKLGLFMFEY